MDSKTRKAMVEVVESYVNGLGNGDFSKVPFAPDVTYESPISPKKTGQEVIDFLSGLFPIIEGVQIKEHIVEGDTCATVFDLNTIHGSVHIFDRFWVENDRLKSISPYYDPAPLRDAQIKARQTQLKSVAGVYFEGMAKKDMSAVPWDDDVVLRSPLAPGGLGTPLEGKPAVLAWFAELYSVLGEMKVIEHYFNEDLTVIASRSDVGITSPPCTLPRGVMKLSGAVKRSVISSRSASK